jgi:two-component system response regulator YesN
MPGYDGLEMINLGKQINKNIDFIIISGYSHFDYAQSAIKYVKNTDRGLSNYQVKKLRLRLQSNTFNKTM